MSNFFNSTGFNNIPNTTMGIDNNFLAEPGYYANLNGPKYKKGLLKDKVELTNSQKSQRATIISMIGMAVAGIGLAILTKGKIKKGFRRAATEGAQEIAQEGAERLAREGAQEAAEQTGQRVSRRAARRAQREAARQVQNNTDTATDALQGAVNRDVAEQVAEDSGKKGGVLQRLFGKKQATETVQDTAERAVQQNTDEVIEEIVDTPAARNITDAGEELLEDITQHPDSGIIEDVADTSFKGGSEVVEKQVAKAADDIPVDVNDGIQDALNTSVKADAPEVPRKPLYVEIGDEIVDLHYDPLIDGPREKAVSEIIDEGAKKLKVNESAYSSVLKDEAGKPVELVKKDGTRIELKYNDDGSLKVSNIVKNLDGRDTTYKSIAYGEGQKAKSIVEETYRDFDVVKRVETHRTHHPETGKILSVNKSEFKGLEDGTEKLINQSEKTYGYVEDGLFDEVVEEISNDENPIETLKTQAFYDLKGRMKQVVNTDAAGEKTTRTIQYKNDNPIKKLWNKVTKKTPAAEGANPSFAGTTALSQWAAKQQEAVKKVAADIDKTTQKLFKQTDDLLKKGQAAQAIEETGQEVAEKTAKENPVKQLLNKFTKKNQGAEVVKDKYASYASVVKDDFGNPVRLVKKDGTKIDLKYDADGIITDSKIFHPDGAVTKKSYYNGKASLVEKFESDDIFADRIYRKHISHDYRTGKVSQKQTVNADGDIVETFIYDKKGNLQETVKAPGRVVKPDGTVVDLQYNSRTGYVSRSNISHPDGSNAIKDYTDGKLYGIREYKDSIYDAPISETDVFRDKKGRIAKVVTEDDSGVTTKSYKRNIQGKFKNVEKTFDPAEVIADATDDIDF